VRAIRFSGAPILTQLPYNADQYSVIKIHPRTVHPLHRSHPCCTKGRQALFYFAKDWFTLNDIA
jgi:hypothetical protein